MKKNDISSIHYLRIIACFLVIVTHTVALLQKEYGNVLNYQLILIGLIAKIAVPIFFMISGALLLQKDSSYKEMIKKSIFRIILPLLIMSIIIFFKRTPVLSFNNIVLFIRQFIGNEIVFPYWFLYTLLGLYIVTPLLQKIIKKLDKYDYNYYFVLSVIMLTIYPILVHYSILPNNINLYIDIIGIPIYYYVMGHYIYNISKNNGDGKIIASAIISLIIMFSAPFIVQYDILNKLKYTLWYDLFSLPIMCFSISLVYLFKIYLNKPAKSTLISKIVKEISNNTFYVYLIHVVLLGHFEFIYYYVKKSIGNIYISYLIHIICIFIIMNVISSIIRIVINFIKKGSLLWQKKN